MGFKYNPLTGKLDLNSVTSPGGSDTQFQYNNAGAFAGTASVRFVSGELIVTPSAIAKAGLTLQYIASQTANILQMLNTSGVNVLGVDKDGYFVSNTTNKFRFKSTTQNGYIELDPVGPDGYGALILSGLTAIYRRSTSVDMGDNTNSLNLNFRGNDVAFFNGSQAITYGNSTLVWRWNNFGAGWSNTLWVGHASTPDNTNFRLRVIPGSTTQIGFATKAFGAYTANHYQALPSSSEVPGFAVDSSFKLQWGDGAGTAVDTNLYRSAANLLVTDDVFGVKAGTSTAFAKAGGTIFDYYTDVGNSGTSETDLYSSSIAANTFATNGDKVEAKYGGIFVSSGTATRQVKVYFAGTAILDTGALTISSSASWSIDLLLIRVSSTVVRYTVTLQTTGNATQVYSATGELTSLTLSGANTLKITGTAAGVGAASNDIVAKLGTVGWKSAA